MLQRLLLRGRRALSSSSASPWLSESLPASVQALLAPHSEALLAPRATPNCMAPGQQVFCNREVRFDRIEVLGFDYDYTLASYSVELQHLIYAKARDHLLERLRYPPELKARSYDAGFPIRGLVFDRRHGVLLKLSYAHSISAGTAYLGRRQLGEEELHRMYGEAMHVPPELVASHMLVLNDLFSLAEACLLADVVQLAVESKVCFDAAAISADVSKAISWVHLSGAMHDLVAAHPEKYLQPSPALGALLADSRAAGKQLFLLTNSAFGFVDAGMKFLIGKAWRELFDVVITSAQKPSFYNRDSPFRVMQDSLDVVRWSHADAADIAAGRVLIGGSLRELERLTGWAGRKVLYVGDHLHADLREPRRGAGWATAAIVRELEAELAVVQTGEYAELHRRSMEVDRALRRVQELGLPAPQLASVLDALETEREKIRSAVPFLFNAHFGSVFRHRSDSTAYALAVKKHVDLYASRLEHLLAMDKAHRFYPTRCKLLPHDPK